MHQKRLISLVVLLVVMVTVLAGCSSDSKTSIKLDPKNPVTVSVWHYYNGATMNALNDLIKEFNETVGKKEGIIVEGYGLGSIPALEEAVLNSVNKKVGSMAMPAVFASYADTAYEIEKLGMLANLDNYWTKEEQAQYFDSYVEEGRIGLKGELRIFPIAKSTETFMINETDWLPFAEANGLTYDDLKTSEGVARVAKLYYEWTDAQTPDILNDGKAFYGRDSMANMFIIASKELGTEIFLVKDGKVTLQVDRDIMRRLWDVYYVSYISGYFLSAGRYRSDDTKVGDILAYIGSTSSAAYFPTIVTVDGEDHAITPRILSMPRFEGAEKVMVQQGAGMVVTKGDPKVEYASVVFLKWFTDVKVNSGFSALSGYMPVKKEAAQYDAYLKILEENHVSLDDTTDKTLSMAFAEIKDSQLYTSKAFDGGASARAVLDNLLQSKAAADRQAVVQLMEQGVSLQDAVAQFNTEDAFGLWFEALNQQLEAAVK